MPDFSHCRCSRHLTGELAPDQAHDEMHLKVVTMPVMCQGYANGCVCAGCTHRAERRDGPTVNRRRIRQPWEPTAA